ncbi:hypothetical protein HanXRQr2_MTg0834751 (mitochondrion) [Helianthus annuus]|uniref:Uncharacterized protein n=1 Tax=Helianthus annuus TaxID=4232 RepID=A0A9K3DCK8_HELAN|nr:hypothetical protein HanXRQr2_MTg0834751 [Helianthus annuus]
MLASLLDRVYSCSGPFEAVRCHRETIPQLGLQSGTIHSALSPVPYSCLLFFRNLL